MRCTALPARGTLPRELRESVEPYVSCVAGALQRDECYGIVRNASFGGTDREHHRKRAENGAVLRLNCLLRKRTLTRSIKTSLCTDRLAVQHVGEARRVLSGQGVHGKARPRSILHEREDLLPRLIRIDLDGNLEAVALTDLGALQRGALLMEVRSHLDPRILKLEFPLGGYLGQVREETERHSGNEVGEGRRRAPLFLGSLLGQTWCPYRMLVLAGCQSRRGRLTLRSVFDKE